MKILYDDEGGATVNVIEFYSKKYHGELIFSKKRDDIEISIYLLNLAQDKYLVLQKQGCEAKDFVVTGLDKVYAIMDLIDRTYDFNELEEGITTSLDRLQKECYIKNLKKVDREKYRGMIVNYYDKNYPMFAVLGIRLPDLMQEANKMAAF